MDEERPRMERFEEFMAPHLDAAYNLARYLTRDPHDAQDVVQEACLRALRFFGDWRGQDARSWLLAIVRNTGYTWLSRNRRGDTATDPDAGLGVAAGDDSDPVLAVSRSADQRQLAAALERLPVEFREVLVLREMEELSYKQIAGIAGVPIGTVMSRLARGRALLRAALAAEAPE